MTDISREWGAWVRRVRADAGDHTQAAASRRTGISQAYLSEWERGRVPRLELVDQFADAYGIDREEARRHAGIEVPKPLEDRIAERLREGGGLMSPAQVVAWGLHTRTKEWGIPLPVDLHRGVNGISTYEAAYAFLADLDKQYEEGLLQ
jgi:transcriptional regulator with XRE-family HTH domain